MSKALAAIAASAGKNLRTTWKYARVEMMPPSPREFGEVRAGYNNLMQAFKQNRWRQTPIREAWLNTMVAMEIAFWFYIGEVIGRGSLYGYMIPGH